MRKYIYPILCPLLIVSQGCDHFLGNKPKGYAIPEAFEDYVKLLASQSLNSCMSTDAFYLTDDVHLLDDTVSAADLAYANQDDHERNLYSFKGGQIYTPGSDDNLWNAAYERIYTFNTIINNVLSSTDATDAEKHRLRAEALYQRAFRNRRPWICYTRKRCRACDRRTAGQWLCNRKNFCGHQFA